MKSVYRRIVRALLVAGCGLLPLFGFIDCNLERGNIEFDLEALGIDIDDDEISIDLF